MRAPLAAAGSGLLRADLLHGYKDLLDGPATERGPGLNVEGGGWIMKKEAQWTLPVV
jgi:hypothetical protein